MLGSMFTMNFYSISEISKVDAEKIINNRKFRYFS